MTKTWCVRSMKRLDNQHAPNSMKLKYKSKLRILWDRLFDPPDITIHVAKCLRYNNNYYLVVKNNSLHYEKLCSGCMNGES